MTQAIKATAATDIPHTLAGALDPAWLSQILAPAIGGATLTGVEVVEVQKTMATKVRFVARWAGGAAAFCLKAFLDMEPANAAGMAVTIVESDFYTDIAPRLTVQVPALVAAVVDRAAGHGVIIMRDMVVEGARFCTALEPFTPDQTAASLDQLARLHAGRAVLADVPWISHRIGEMAHSGVIPQDMLQGLLDGPRGEPLDARTRDAGLLRQALSALAVRDAALPQTLVHGDCHAGNVFQTAAGPGLIDWQLLQHGNWSLDVAYHIAATLPVASAEREEKRLLADYLDRARGYGCETPDLETAHRQYRAAAVWGYFLWAITRKVDPPIILAFVERLGSAVMRHDSFRLLDV
jgi:aminoglycoside phosphotransferase (APT) family kinase protein